MLNCRIICSMPVGSSTSSILHDMPSHNSNNAVVLRTPVPSTCLPWLLYAAICYNLHEDYALLCRSSIAISGTPLVWFQLLVSEYGCRLINTSQYGSLPFQEVAPKQRCNDFCMVRCTADIARTDALDLFYASSRCIQSAA